MRIAEENLSTNVVITIYTFQILTNDKYCILINIYYKKFKIFDNYTIVSQCYCQLSIQSTLSISSNACETKFSLCFFGRVGLFEKTFSHEEV